jgi:pyruvate formate lyase activating enzyme
LTNAAVKHELSLPVGGLVPLSTLDWPDHLAAVVFLKGCPWACPYCHNPDLQHGQGQPGGFERVLELLDRRRELLDGVVFSGGEPTRHPDLAVALGEVRALGFETGLHTGGAYPERLARLLEAGLVDWVGFDVKAPWGQYDRVTGRAGSGERARRSLELLVASGVDYELRTTVDPRLLDGAAIESLAGELAGSGALGACGRGPGASRGQLVLQRCLGDDPARTPVPGLDLGALAARLSAALHGQVLARA